MKKYFIQPIFIYTLVVQVLIGTIGIPRHTRSCRMPDMVDKSTLFMAPNSCCEPQDDDHPHDAHKVCTIPKTKPINPCCNFQADFLKIDFESPFLNVEDVSLDGAFSLLPELPFIAYHITNQANFWLAPEYASNSPPLRGRHICIRHQSFLL